MNFIGIDPGLKGGLALIENGILHLWITPLIGDKEYDVQRMKDLLVFAKSKGPLTATIEKQMALPGQGLSSTMKTGMGFGLWLGLLSGLNISHQVIPAQSWQNKLFIGLSKKEDTKVLSEIVAKRLFPSADFRRSDRAKVSADGLTDAACIAEYGRRTYVQEQPMPGTHLGMEPMFK